MIVKKIMAHLDNERARTKRLIAYILNPETENNGEKCAFSECRNFCNSDSPERMRAEMFAMAEGCGTARPKSILQHWVLSWNGLEKPGAKTIIQAAKEFIGEMGMGNNQSVIGVHVNTENLHTHIAVSRVNPATMTLVDDSQDIYRAHKAIARIENKLGCAPEHNALFKWSPFKGAVPNEDYSKNNSLYFRNTSPEPITVLLSENTDPGEIPGMNRKDNIYYSKSSGEITGVIDDGKLHLFKWAYKDIVKYLLHLKEEKRCRIVVQNDLVRLFSRKKMTRKDSMAFAKANFNKQGKDLYTGNSIVPLPDDPFVLSRILPVIPKATIEPSEIDNVYRHYIDLKTGFRKKKIPESRVRVVAALMMRKEAISRGDIEEVLRRDGLETSIARHICAWLYSEQGNATLYAFEKAGFFNMKPPRQGRTRKKPRKMQRKNYDPGIEERVRMQIESALDDRISEASSHGYTLKM